MTVITSIRKSRGFSLIEILIALALVAVISVAAIPNFKNIFRTSTESFARKTAVLFGEARDYAVLRNAVVRVQIDLEAQEYWVEEAPQSILLPAEARTDDKRDSKQIEQEKKDTQASFKMIKDITKDKRKVPKGIRLVAVISSRYIQPVETGTASIYYFPHGQADAAILHMEDTEEIKRSLVVHPITGIAKLVAGFEKGREK